MPIFIKSSMYVGAGPAKSFSDSMQNYCRFKRKSELHELISSLTITLNAEVAARCEQIV